MRIYVMNRGGLSVYGGLYDPHRNEAVVLVRDEDESISVTIEYHDVPSSPSATASSLTCSTPTLTTGTNKLTATLSSINDGGYVDISATVGGETKKVRIRARSQKAPDTYDEGVDAI